MINFIDTYIKWISEISNNNGYNINDKDKIYLYLCGIGEELSEYINAIDSSEPLININQELGDIFKYIVLLSNELNINDILINAITQNKKFHKIDIPIVQYYIFNMTKRHLRNQINLDLNEKCIFIIESMINYVMGALDYNLEKLKNIINININKLTERFIIKSDNDNNYDFKIDLLDYAGLDLKEIKALDFNGNNIDLPVDDTTGGIIEVQKDGKLYTSSFLGGIVMFDYNINKYITLFLHNKTILNIAVFYNIEVKK